MRNLQTLVLPLYICHKLVRAQTLNNKHAKYCTCASSLIYGKQSSIIQFMIHILNLSCYFDTSVDVLKLFHVGKTINSLTIFCILITVTGNTPTSIFPICFHVILCGF